MPTGYTHRVQEGEITELRQFALYCARAFIPPKFEARTDYHDKAIAAANEKLLRIPAMTDEECDKAAHTEFVDSHEEWVKRGDRRMLHRQRYEDMLAKVRAWHAPEACEKLKEFMVEQLTSSISFDCDGKYDTEPQRQAGVQWRVAQLKDATHDLEYHTRERAETIARNDERNRWLDALRASLVGMI